MTLRDQFERAWPEASSSDPIETALIFGEDVQSVADHLANTWNARPMIWIVPVYVGFGELEQVAIGNAVSVQYDYPGLKDGRNLRVIGRQGGLKPGVITLTLWG